jgi:hypothetical protein
MSENQKLLITDPCDIVTVSDIKPGKQGLNSWLRPILQGGGGSVLTHYLITWLETDGQLGTRDGSSGRPGALLEISFPTKNSSTPYSNIHTVFVTGEDEYSRYKHRRYNYITTVLPIQLYTFHSVYCLNKRSLTCAHCLNHIVRSVMTCLDRPSLPYYGFPLPLKSCCSVLSVLH